MEEFGFPEAQGPFERLSDRQYEVVSRKAVGFSAREISAAMSYSVKWVENRVQESKWILGRSTPGEVTMLWIWWHGHLIVPPSDVA